MDTHHILYNNSLYYELHSEQLFNMIVKQEKIIRYVEFLEISSDRICYIYHKRDCLYFELHRRAFSNCLYQMCSYHKVKSWVEGVTPETRCKCCKPEYYEFEHDCERIDNGEIPPTDLINAILSTRALTGGKCFFFKHPEDDDYFDERRSSIWSGTFDDEEESTDSTEEEPPPPDVFAPKSDVAAPKHDTVAPELDLIELEPEVVPPEPDDVVTPQPNVVTHICTLKPNIVPHEPDVVTPETDGEMPESLTNPTVAFDSNNVNNDNNAPESIARESDDHSSSTNSINTEERCLIGVSRVKIVPAGAGSSEPTPSSSGFGTMGQFLFKSSKGKKPIPKPRFFKPSVHFKDKCDKNPSCSYKQLQDDDDAGPSNVNRSADSKISKSTWYLGFPHL